MPSAMMRFSWWWCLCMNRNTLSRKLKRFTKFLAINMPYKWQWSRNSQRIDRRVSIFAMTDIRDDVTRQWRYSWQKSLITAIARWSLTIKFACWAEMNASRATLGKASIVVCTTASKPLGSRERRARQLVSWHLRSFCFVFITMSSPPQRGHTSMRGSLALECEMVSKMPMQLGSFMPVMVSRSRRRSSSVLMSALLRRKMMGAMLNTSLQIFSSNGWKRAFPELMTYQITWMLFRGSCTW
mmetsp:Transcript_2150/g.5064  ORF Transcript_2150/g.5064 Transcript_2150/m.5064 type:complete len:241 (+) Transcript_2150:671-1393(+)